jgi:Fe-S cluster assembly protein SufD
MVNYLAEKKNLIAFDKNEIINNSNIKIKGNSFELSSDNEFFLVLDNVSDKELIFNLYKAKNIKLYILSFQSRKSEINLVFNLKENAELELFTQFSSKRRTSLKVKASFNLETNSQLKIRNALVFNGNLKFDEKVNLLGEHAGVDIDVLNVGSNNDLHEVTQEIHHEAKNTYSEINNWLITTNNAFAKYSVSGYISKGKELSKCHQHNQGIMLSDSSAIEVEPKLYIDEYNVEASHGAAIGQMDEEELFYLLSRGLTESEAKSLIISGYINPFVNMIEDADVKKKLTSQISRIIRRS